MDKISKIGLKADLTHLTCGLRHHPDDTPQDKKAVDYIVQNLGFHIDEVREEVKDEYVIPVCQECMDSLLSGEWVIIYCTSCHSSKWIWLKYTCRVFDSAIQWNTCCPNCKT